MSFSLLRAFVLSPGSISHAPHPKHVSSSSSTTLSALRRDQAMPGNRDSLVVHRQRRTNHSTPHRRYHLDPRCRPLRPLGMHLIRSAQLRDIEDISHMGMPRKGSHGVKGIAFWTVTVARVVIISIILGVPLAFPPVPYILPDPWSILHA